MASGQLAPPTSESAVHNRYSAAAQAREPALCCPVEYAGDYLAVIPAEIIERDYGCGDPSPYVQPGDVVLDLGSGAGKLCYILSQVVGADGRVSDCIVNTPSGVDAHRLVGAAPPVGSRRYNDRYRREDGRWKFASRVVVFDQRSKRSVPNPEPFGAPEDDPSHQLRSGIFARGPRA